MYRMSYTCTLYLKHDIVGMLTTNIIAFGIVHVTDLYHGARNFHGKKCHYHLYRGYGDIHFTIFVEMKFTNACFRVDKIFLMWIFPAIWSCTRTKYCNHAYTIYWTCIPIAEVSQSPQELMGIVINEIHAYTIYMNLITNVHCLTISPKWPMLLQIPGVTKECDNNNNEG